MPKNRIFKAAVVLSASIVIAASFATYNEFDNSLNTSTRYESTNILGFVGAYIADIFMQMFGLASWFIVLFLLCLAINILLTKDIQRIKLKIISGFASIFILSTFIDHYLLNNPNKTSNILFHLEKLFGPWFLCVMILVFFLTFLYSLGFKSEIYARLLFGIFYIFKPSEKKPEPYINTGAKLKATTEIPASPVARSIHTVSSSPRKLPIVKDKNFNDGFNLPDLELLRDKKSHSHKAQTSEELEYQAERLMKVLKDFGVRGHIIQINQGPVVTLYEFEPAAGTKSSRVISLSDDIARSLSALSARIAVIPGRNALGIELPNEEREFFRIRELIESREYQDYDHSLPIILGKDISGKPTIVDLAKMPHLLVAGTTGSGKSVAINTMIISLLYKNSPKQCKFIMIDPKMLELSVYDGIPHLLSPVVTEPGKAVVALKWAVKEMENRYRLMSNLGVRNISGYNNRIDEAIARGEELKRTVQTGFDPETGKPIFESVPIEMEKLPFIVVIVDEMADLMLVAGKDIESSIQRLAQMARAAGIHIIMATQRPSVDVITGVIKANFPSRVSFRVTSKIDSRTILGEQGAEQLLGMGDMLYMGQSSRITRVHGPFVEDSEVERITNYLKSQGEPEYIDAVTTTDEDEIDESIIDSDDVSDEGLYKKALQIVKRDRKSSTSYIQRSLRIGYNRAALLVERLERDGVISAPNHSGKREILIEED
ncbi:MAG: DNA translocase FtsK 4TM domain-containing protein [Rickettsiaceae bacterium]|nr:DNA translocase FtsK 4TM domain-containing protein [Rickettsiaceae bacterium]